MKNIIIVEDNKHIRELLSDFLTEQNFFVQTFESVKDFYNTNKTYTPNLYIFDVMLSDGYGTELCKSTKQNTESKNIPVLLMSAHSKSKNIEDCKCDIFIKKPFDLENLLEQIKILTA